jgi:hypothetical protein
LPKSGMTPPVPKLTTRIPWRGASDIFNLLPI